MVLINVGPRGAESLPRYSGRFKLPRVKLVSGLKKRDELVTKFKVIRYSVF